MRLPSVILRRCSAAVTPPIRSSPTTSRTASLPPGRLPWRPCLVGPIDGEASHSGRRGRSRDRRGSTRASRATRVRARDLSRLGRQSEDRTAAAERWLGVAPSRHGYTVARLEPRAAYRVAVLNSERGRYRMEHSRALRIEIEEGRHASLPLGRYRILIGEFPRFAPLFRICVGAICQWTPLGSLVCGSGSA